MADFVQTMKDWLRMCQFMDKEYGNSSCDNCPLGGCSAVYEMCGKENFSNMEHNIVAWAAEHPEPVYPTWGEWLMSIGVISGLFPNGAIDALGNLKQPIPADLAEKLGIEPKEVKR